MNKTGAPFAGRGQVIGLLGGSFDPAHQGHVHISKVAINRFGLDRVWWLVSPGNPLKSRGPAAMERRLRHARDLVDDPRIVVTDLEERLGTRYTANTLSALQKMYPNQQFVWLMGADNLAQFHLWQDWEEILHSVPVGVLARPGQRISARMSRAAKIYERFRLPGRYSASLPRHTCPCWCFINLPMSDQSSTKIRAAGRWS